ncbi:MAG: outer membrane protein assembly factor BamE [Methylococcales bacterium]|nr:outer membrane protein assembly factor BamE [Methylococcales bacterium]
MMIFFRSAFSIGLLRKTSFGLILSILLLSSGCASVGHEFPAGQVSTIRIGETTQNDIYTTFGAPWRTGIENGMKTWTYGNYHYSLFNDASTEDLVIKFDKKGVVSAFVFNTTKRSK